MAAPNASTFDLVPPTRPGTATFNGIAKIDDEEETPDVQTMPNAAEWNTIEWLVLAACRVMPVAVFSVTTSPRAIQKAALAPKTPVIATFTLTYVGTGIFEITWPAGTFPTSVANPTVSLNDGPGACWAEAITNGVRVKTYNGAFAAYDLSFTVSVY